MPDPATGPAQRSPLAIVFFTIFLDLLGIGILIPVIPQLLANPDSAFVSLNATIRPAARDWRPEGLARVSIGTRDRPRRSR